MARAPYLLNSDRMLARLHELLNGLDLGKQWDVTIEPHKRRRSLSQNALYWKWIGIVAKDTGHDNDDLHEFFKTKFLEPRIVELGTERREVRSTTKLTSAEMKDYMDRVYAFVTSELGMLLPLPEEAHQRAA